MTGSFENWMVEVAPNDVLEMIRGLEAAGYRRADVRGGPDASFGNVAVEWRGDDLELPLIQERGLWELGFRLADGSAHTFDLVSRVRRGTDRWGPSPGLAPLHRQDPPDVGWAEEMPLCLAWLRDTPAAGARLEEASVRKAETLGWSRGS